MSVGILDGLLTVFDPLDPIWRLATLLTSGLAPTNVKMRLGNSVIIHQVSCNQDSIAHILAVWSTDSKPCGSLIQMYRRPSLTIPAVDVDAT